MEPAGTAHKVISLELLQTEKSKTEFKLSLYGKLLKQHALVVADCVQPSISPLMIMA